MLWLPDDHCFDLSKLENTVERTCKIAVEDPKVLYLFMQRYAYFNSYAGALVARLASAIGLSRDLFNDSSYVVADEADRGLEIAQKVIAAGDLDHRALAQDTLKAIADYAELTPRERNQISIVPPWLKAIVNELIEGYQGTPGDVASMIRGMGFHAASEIMADREYTLIDKVVRLDNKGKGFDAYLEKLKQEAEAKEQEFTAWNWVGIHATHNASGAEAEHFDLALEALDLMAQFRPEPKQQLKEWVCQGFLNFVDIEQRLFKGIYEELLPLTVNQLQVAS